MTEILLAFTAFIASLLSLFPGFGLGTLLLPAFALFLPVEVAVASTAIVHGANSLFKTLLLRRDINLEVTLRFGIPAILSAAVGAAFLGLLALQDTLVTWELGAREAHITPLRLVMGTLILGFAVAELRPSFRPVSLTRRTLPIGGILSGFFGGLSGHQGALRAAFLSPLGLPPASYAATQALLGLMVDVSRLGVYAFTAVSAGLMLDASSLPHSHILVAVAAAFMGVLLGKRLLPSTTVGTVRKITGILLILIGLALGLGIT